MTRNRDVADTQDNLGGAVAPFVAGKNVLINGNFDWWQRSTSSATNGGYLTADRWNIDSNFAVKSQQTTGAPNGARYIFRNAFTSATSAYSSVVQYVETAQVVPIWGQAVTGSVKLRRSSGMASNLTFFIQKNVTVDAGPANGGWTSMASVVASNASLPTGTGSSNWFTATFTTTIPNDGTANSVRVLVVTDSEPGNGSYWEMAQVQLELGSVATPFARAGGSIGGELALCQRYYQRITTTTTFGRLGFGMATGTTNCQVIFPLKQTMRTSVSALDFSGTTHFVMNDGVSNTATNAAPTLDSMQNPDNCLVIFSAASGLTQFRPYNIAGNNNATAFIGFSAEL